MFIIPSIVLYNFPILCLYTPGRHIFDTEWPDVVDLLALVDIKYAVLHDIGKQEENEIKEKVENAGVPLEEEEETGWSQESDIDLGDDKSMEINESDLNPPVLKTSDKTPDTILTSEEKLPQATIEVNVTSPETAEKDRSAVNDKSAVNDQDSENSKAGWSEESDLDLDDVEESENVHLAEREKSDPAVTSYEPSESSNLTPSSDLRSEEKLNAERPTEVNTDNAEIEKSSSVQGCKSSLGNILEPLRIDLGVFFLKNH